jgi:UDP-N-acetylmuramate dehydrogenase
LIIGSGSNILVIDKPLNAAVIHLKAACFTNLSRELGVVKAGAGAGLGRFVKYALKHCLSGAEFLIGIPGTLGGALAMNAGGWGKCIGDLVVDATVIDYNGKVKVLKKREIKFGYRKSSLSKYIILGARFKLRPSKKKHIKDNLDRYIKYRKETQDLTLPSAGCIFRNPNDHSAGKAGRLIDLCGLKGASIGGACVSRKHANFILNKSHAKAEDILRLKKLIEDRVKGRFGIILEPEIIIWR